MPDHIDFTDYANAKNDVTVTSQDIIHYMTDYNFGDGKKFTYDEIVKNK